MLLPGPVNRDIGKLIPLLRDAQDKVAKEGRTVGGGRPYSLGMNGMFGVLLVARATSFGVSRVSEGWYGGWL